MKKKTAAVPKPNERLEAYMRKLKEADARVMATPPVHNPLPEGVVSLDADRVPRWLKNEFDLVKATKKWPLYLWGSFGRGKTYASAYFYCTWPEPAMWMNFKLFCDRTAQLERDGELTYYDQQHKFHEHTRESWWGSIARTGLFVCDDVGVGEQSFTRTEALWALLEARTGKPLIMTGNLTLDELHLRFDGRVISRVYAGTEIEIRGDDQRTFNHQDRHRFGIMQDSESTAATKKEQL